MDTTASSFSTRSNAKRTAGQMIAKGVAPAADYGIEPITVEDRKPARCPLLTETGRATALTTGSVRFRRRVGY
jgi:hypothetical protein